MGNTHLIKLPKPSVVVTFSFDLTLNIGVTIKKAGIEVGNTADYIVGWTLKEYKLIKIEKGPFILEKNLLVKIKGDVKIGGRGKKISTMKTATKKTTPARAVSKKLALLRLK